MNVVKVLPAKSIRQLTENCNRQFGTPSGHFGHPLSGCDTIDFMPNDQTQTPPKPEPEKPKEEVKSPEKETAVIDKAGVMQSIYNNV